jgi:hypothetical protein
VSDPSILTRADLDLAWLRFKSSRPSFMVEPVAERAAFDTTVRLAVTERMLAFLRANDPFAWFLGGVVVGGFTVIILLTLVAASR